MSELGRRETLDHLGLRQQASRQRRSDATCTCFCLLLPGAAADGRVRRAHAGTSGAPIIRAATAALASSRDEPVGGMARLPNAGQPAGHGKRPEHRHQDRNTQIALVPRVTRPSLVHHVHFVQQGSLVQPRRPPLPHGLVGGIREREPVQPIERVEHTRRAPAQRATAVDEYDQPPPKTPHGSKCGTSGASTSR